MVTGASRARRLRLVLTDCDGVLTDGGVYYGEAGEALKRFNVRDGMGVERLREVGIATAIVTREQSPCVRRRSEKLRLPYLFLGVEDKARALPGILSTTGVSMDDVAYIGDDVNDLGVIAAVSQRGLTAAPSDAMRDVRDRVQFLCPSPGGQGAFRDFAEWILSLRTAAVHSAARGGA